MNRIIKFRAWDDVEKKMYSAVDIFNDPKNGIWYEDDQDGSLSINKIMDNYGIRRKLISMQFTGFLDVNKKEIYEGDIVKYVIDDQYANMGTHIGEIMFSSGSFRSNIDFTRPHRYGDNMSYHPAVNDCVVLGNVFENKDLLK